MTRKHFEAIAGILADNKEDIEAITFSRLVSQFAQVCREDNEGFDRDRFTKACYTSKETQP